MCATMHQQIISRPIYKIFNDYALWAM